MPTLSNMTIRQMRDSTKAQIIDSVVEFMRSNFTKRQLIQFLRDRETEWDDPITTYRADGQIESQIDIERDVETGLQVSKKVMTWSYYASGEVNVIKTEFYDGNDALKRTRRVKHFRDGRQPEGEG